MRTSPKLLLQSNSLLVVNLLVLCLLLYGLLHVYGTTYLGQISIYTGAFIAAYLLLDRLSGKRRWQLPDWNISPAKLRTGVDSIIVFTLIFQIIHYLLLGNVPLIKAMLSTDYYGIAQIRQDIKQVNHVLIAYPASFLLKAVIPFTLFLLYRMDKRRFWVFFFIGLFYALALMQKAFIVTALIPLVMHLLFERKWWKALFFSGCFAGGVVLLVIVTNPLLRPAPFDCGTCELAGPKKDKEDTRSGSAKATDAIYQRVFVTTGEIVGDWFRCIPDSIPHAYGSGYSFGARLTGRTYVDYPSEVYKKIRPEEAAMGLDGTATTAHFMYDYANFGNWGLLLSGIYTAVFLLLIRSFFRDDTGSMFALNGIYIIWLSSAPFTSTFFSGGWALTILLYLVFKPLIQLSKPTARAEKHPA